MSMPYGATVLYTAQGNSQLADDEGLRDRRLQVAVLTGAALPVVVQPEGEHAAFVIDREHVPSPGGDVSQHLCVLSQSVGSVYAKEKRKIGPD